jgi:hypothetical protein
MKTSIAAPIKAINFLLLKFFNVYHPQSPEKMPESI